jgi:hypothetical protein
MSLTTAENGAMTLSHERFLVCLEALWEMEVLAGMLPGLVPEDEHDAHYAVRGVAGRLRDLSRAAMSGLDDAAMETAELERRVLIRGKKDEQGMA